MLFYSGKFSVSLSQDLIKRILSVLHFCFGNVSNRILNTFYFIHVGEIIIMGLHANHFGPVVTHRTQ